MVQRTIRKRYDAYRACYEQALKEDDDLEGDVVIRLVVAPDGHIQDEVQYTSTLASPVVADCLTRIFVQLEFPPPDPGPVTIVCPFGFAPE